jgi:hypothetical protein
MEFRAVGQLGGLRFHRHREGMDEGGGRRAALHPDGGQFHLVGARRDHRVDAGTNWELGLSAVLEEKDGTKSYWALAHPPGDKPDFHHPDCFAARLALSSRHDPVRNRPAARRAGACAAAGRQARRAARPSGVGHPRPDPQPRRARRGGVRSPPPSARSTACAATSRTIWWSPPDFTDPVHHIPVFSLYGEVRRPTGQSMGTFDTILIDLQDLGCRIYTFITTLALRARSRGRARQERVGARSAQPAGPPDRRADAARRLGELRRRGPIPMRHGLTLGELGPGSSTTSSSTSITA